MQISGSDYTYIALFFISIMLSIVFGLSYKTIQPKKHTLIWSLVFALAAVKGVINATNHIFTDRDFYWIFINAFSLLLQWLTWAGFRLRAKRSPFELKLIFALIFIELILVYFTVFNPHAGYRMMLIPLFGGIMMFLCGWEIFNTQNKVRPAEAAAIIIFSLYGLTQIAAGIIALSQGPTVDSYYLDLYQQVNLIFMPAAFTGMGVFTLLILVDDIGEKLKALAVTDSLTQVFNRRGFYQKSKVLTSGSNYGDAATAAIIITDIDNFKTINDKYGHHAGDKALICFSKLLTTAFNDSAVVGRIGGEEFVILLHTTAVNKNSLTTYELVERCRKETQELDISHGNNTFNLTASFGIVEFHISDSSIEDQLRKADQALYDAKNQGRNCSVIYQDPDKDIVSEAT
ncbi:GGDEF domain-containing protein [Kangiella sp. HZ709]|uniref:GGDEF domain-containing protein n=1 Tax=Kangiella sp. HZ709 TaxID=2666328 RepID=UPI0012B15BE2|nr:GGDEF domain-containing protein [Kangiella sp. HZ709]MRX28339.1 diguanylate cyclase [Kangiella sp. HZ709]